MIITLIVVVGFLAGIGILIHWWRHDYFNDSLEWLGFMLITIFGIGLLIVGIVTIINRGGNDLHKTKLQEERAAIVYQMEQGMYYGSSLGEFNAELKKSQMLHESPWTNLLIGDYVMEIEPIDLEK